jgi:hypothetical protein
MALLGHLRVTDVSIRHLDCLAVILDAVPDPCVSSDLVLTLLKIYAVHRASAECPLQRVLTTVALSWVRSDLLPGDSGICAGLAVSTLVAADSSAHLNNFQPQRWPRRLLGDRSACACCALACPPEDPDVGRGYGVGGARD